MSIRQISDHLYENQMAIRSQRKVKNELIRLT